MGKNRVIYAIQVEKSEVHGLKIINVKIGKTNDINSTLSQYKRSHPTVDVLNLWELNKDVNSSLWEGVAHRIADNHAFKKKKEVFFFLEDSYGKFSKDFSQLLKKKTLKKIPERKEKKEGEVDLVEKAKGINFIGSRPKVVRFKDQTFEVKSWREAARVIGGKVYEEVDDFSRAEEIKGRKRIFFSTNENDVVNPINIPNSPWYVTGHGNANWYITTLSRLLNKFNYDKDEVKIILEERDK